MKKNQKLIAALAGFAVLIAVLAGIYVCTRPEAQAGGKTITVSVVHRDGSEKSFTFQTDAEYLAQALVAEGLIQGEESEFGLYVTAVDGEAADYSADQSWWYLTKGGEAWMTGASETVIADGEHYEWTFTVG